MGITLHLIKSRLTFNLNSFEDVPIVCASGNEQDNKGAVIRSTDPNAAAINYFQVGSTTETCMCYVLVVMCHFIISILYRY